MLFLTNNYSLNNYSLKSKLSILLFILSFFCFKNTQAQLSKKHFIPPLTYAETGNANPENQYFYISTPSNKDVSYTIKQIGFPSSDITGIVSSSSPQEIFIASGDSQLFVDSRQTSAIHNNKGYIVEASDVIYVSIRVLAGGGAQAGALVSKGSSALGTTFRAGMYTNENPQTNYLNFISVMASEDNTQVTFDDLPTGISIKNYTGTLPISITLNEGESYVIATNASDNDINKDGLIGTLISSDKNIVVNTGSANGSFHNGGGRDYGIDQIVGLDKIGTEYIFVKGGGNDGWENVLIVAHEDNTTVSINNNGVSSTINKGEFTLIEGNEFNANGNMFVKTSKPVFAYQGVGASGSEANQGMFFVPPLSCESRGKVDNIPSIESIGTVTFTGGITVVTNANATVNINSMPITDFATSGPFGIDIDNDGIDDYETYKVTNLTGSISVESSEELYCAYFNVNGAATSGSFYSGFPTAPEINFDTTVTSLGNCISNVTLQAANTDLFDSVKWEYFNENTTTWEEKSTNNTYQPIESEPGRYRLIGKIDCTNTTFESIEIPVSLCPDDFDGDLIIDNLDVDIDNDGILNCDESLGNASINISDIDNPEIIFQDSSTNSAIISRVYTESEVSNSFSGTNTGNFQSIINPAVDSKLQYELKFTQNINFTFTQNKNTDHTISEGEFFILKIGPSNKNVTLLDPDDQLLIDTNFDGEFEVGVTRISASEIHFKYKANTTGAASSFQFLANQVDQIDFKHQSTGLTNASTFNGNLELTCFSLDSDGDGIENMFDLDSDNDGIPDVNEAFPQPSSLSGTDANLDGLDDMFIGLNVDSDGDGIFNYIDLDSDNDGIFDSTEAGHNLDTDFNGIIDNASALVGINGLVDNLETTPDAKVLSLNYMVTNTDNDTDFNFVELDADNDNCFDVTEAGFTDVNNDGILDATPFAFNSNGKVINNVDGYTSPNADYTTSAPITLNNPFLDVTFCENDTNTITIDSTVDSFQWQLSTDGTTWNTISDDAIYSGSSTNNLQITNTPLTYNNNQYRVVLNRTGNGCTETSNAIILTVNPLPILKSNPELEQCISASNNNPTVNLTLAESNISNTQNVTFEYYEDMAGTNQILNFESYPVTVNTSQSVYVKVISDKNCARDLIELKINVGQPTPETTPNIITSPVCDDLLDADGNNTAANSDTDNITHFSLDKTSIIASIMPPLNTTVYFYENATDRDNSLHEIDITNFRNDITKNNVTNVANGIQFPIYYKILSDVNNKCEDFGFFTVQINQVPEINKDPISPISECDAGVVDGNFSNGSNANIDLTQKIDEIFLGTSQDKNDFNFTFYKSETAAFSGDLSSADYIANPTQFTNDVPATFTQGDVVTQSIFVRIENKTTGCVNPHTNFDVIINPLPIITNIIPALEICDMGTKDGDLKNGLAQEIDVSVRDIDILNTKNASEFTITYHKTQADLEDLNSTGIDKNSYDSDPTRVTINPTTNNSEEILFIRIVNNDTECLFDQSTLTIIVNPEPNIPTNINNYSVCDNDSDTFSNDDNGINGDITLNNKIDEILVNYTPVEYSNFNITFYESAAQAKAGDVSVALDPNKYQNTTNDQPIYVRVENIATTCVYDDLSFLINIKPKPSFMVMGEENIDDPRILCLNNTPLTLEVENFAADYNYVWTNESGTEIGYDFEQEVTAGGKYTVTASDKFPDGCERSRTFVVKESNIATLKHSFVTIVDEGNVINSENNLSISIDVINNDLGPGDYQYAIINTTEDDTRTPMIGFQEEPLFENLEGGVYQIIVNDKNGCSPDAKLLVSVIQFPKFFTPNADGKNDTYVVKGVTKDFYADASINIFNRYGKLVGQEQIDSQGWNGMYQGKLLPSDDYWFNITLIPTDTTKPIINKKGNFSLLRRE